MRTMGFPKGLGGHTPVILGLLLLCPVLGCKKTTKAQVPTQRETASSDNDNQPTDLNTPLQEQNAKQDAGSSPFGVPATNTQANWGTPGFGPYPPSLSPVAVELRGLPPATSSLSHLAVQVAGQSYTDYRFAMVPGTLNCTSAAYSEWRPLNRPIDNPITIPGKVRLCVVGRSSTAMQQAPTEYNWVQIQSAEPLVNLSNVPSDGNTTPTLNVYVDGLGIAKYHHVLVEGTNPCPPVPQDISQTQFSPVYAHIKDPITTEGSKKLCVVGVTSSGQIGTRFSEHTWHQGAKPEQQKADPKPEQVRIDLTNVNFESWHKICLFVSANDGPFQKMGCNKQDSEKVREYLEFKSGANNCVKLNFRLEVFGFLKSCEGLEDVSTCEVSSIADPVRMTNKPEDKEFFVAMKLSEISTASLESANIDTSSTTSKDPEGQRKEAETWLSQSEGRSWIRLFIEDQSDAQMNTFKSSGDANRTGIDFDDYVVDIRAVDVGFSLPELGISCAGAQPN